MIATFKTTQPHTRNWPMRVDGGVPRVGESVRIRDNADHKTRLFAVEAVVWTPQAHKGDSVADIHLEFVTEHVS